MNAGLVDVSGGWDAIPFILDLDAGHIMKICVTDRADAVEELAEFLDNSKFPGLLASFACIYLDKAVGLFEEVHEMTDERARILENPRKFFKTSDDQVARDRAAKHFKKYVNAKSPDFLKRAMMALMENGLGNLSGAIVETQFALCHRVYSDFNLTDELSQEIILNTENEQAEILAELIRKYRVK